MNTDIFKNPRHINAPRHFVLFIPHRDMAGPLRTLSRFLFAAGLPGAWSFPQAAPLALVKRPLSPAALQSLASNLRSAAQASAGGKINLGPPELVPCPLFHGFFGPALDLPPPPLPYPGVLYPFPRIVLCTSLVVRGDAVLLTDIPDIPPVSPAFFRAAMVANMTIRHLIPDPPENYSFIWRIGKPRWLPAWRAPKAKLDPQISV